MLFQNLTFFDCHLFNEIHIPYAHTRRCTLSYMLMQTYARARSRAGLYTCMHVHHLTHTYAHICTCTHVYLLIHAYAHLSWLCISMHKRACDCAWDDARACTCISVHKRAWDCACACTCTSVHEIMHIQVMMNDMLHVYVTCP